MKLKIFFSLCFSLAAMISFSQSDMVESRAVSALKMYEKQLANGEKALRLSDAQSVKLKEVLMERENKKMKAQEQYSDKMEFSRKATEIDSEYVTRIEKILTDEQIKTLRNVKKPIHKANAAID
jgi:hypothetical protein